MRLSVVKWKKNAQGRIIGECKTTLRMMLNTQQDFNEASWEHDISKNGFQLHKSVLANKKTDAGRLRVVLAQLIDTTKEDYSNESLDVHRSLNDLSKYSDTNDPDPYAVDIARLPTPLAAPVTFQDYVRDGILLDFCVAIDFTSSNGKRNSQHGVEIYAIFHYVVHVISLSFSERRSQSSGDTSRPIIGKHERL